MRHKGQGCFVFSWDQVELDGLTGADPATMVVGATWRWSGHAMRVEDPSDILVLRPGTEQAAQRAHAATQVRRLFSGELDRTAPGEDSAAPANSFELTDGLARFAAVILDAGAGRAPLVMFRDGLPDPDVDHWVLRQDVLAPDRNSGQGMVCFVPGTLIATPDGQRPVETIRPGDRVLTRDNGPQTVLWQASRRVSAGRLIATPALRPIRIRAGQFGQGRPEPDLMLSPDHRLLVGGSAATELFATDEVLVTARDLVGLPGITRDDRPLPVEYIHLMLDGHQVIAANGLFSESFHPAAADLETLAAPERAALDAIIPGLTLDPMRLGDFARRLASRAEAALMLHGLGSTRLIGC